MREIFRSVPVPDAVLKRPDGSTRQGGASFVVRVFDPGEPIPAGFGPQPFAVWRSSLEPDGSLHARVPTNVIRASSGVVLPDVVVPASLLAALSDDTLIELRWDVIGGIA
jgi:hypothetical protein